MIRLKPAQWQKLHQRLIADNPPSVMMLRYKMKEVLGFTVRNHHEWIEKPNSMPRSCYLREWVYLDFYDDRMETWIRVKYAEYL